MVSTDALALLRRTYLSLRILQRRVSPRRRHGIAERLLRLVCPIAGGIMDRSIRRILQRWGRRVTHPLLAWLRKAVFLG
jgi:hypothetical protein